MTKFDQTVDNVLMKKFIRQGQKQAKKVDDIIEEYFWSVVSNALETHQAILEDQKIHQKNIKALRKVHALLDSELDFSDKWLGTDIRDALKKLDDFIEMQDYLDKTMPKYGAYGTSETLYKLDAKHSEKAINQAQLAALAASWELLFGAPPRSDKENEFNKLAKKLIGLEYRTTKLYLQNRLNDEDIKNKT